MSLDYEKFNSIVESLGYVSSESEKMRRIIVEMANLLNAFDAFTREGLAAAQVFAEVVSRYLDTSTVQNNKQSKWVPFVLGQHRPGQTVRIKDGVYSAGGAWHNGLVGTIVAVRGGRVLVQYSGRTDGVGHNHHPTAIEVLEIE